MSVAIIAAAGISSRLYPLTLDSPKCLLMVGRGQTIIERQIEILNSNGIRKIVVIVGYLEEKIREVLGDSVEIVTNKEYKSTNCSFSLWQAREYAKDGFYYINSDLIINNTIMQNLINSKYGNSIICDTTKTRSPDMFKINTKTNKITQLSKTLKNSNGIAIGPVKFDSISSKKIFNILEEKIRKGNKKMWCYSLFNEALKFIDLYPVEVGNQPWFEIDTLNDYENYCNFINKKP